MYLATLQVLDVCGHDSSRVRGSNLFKKGLKLAMQVMLQLPACFI